MKLVLIETVGNLGNVGQVVNVKPGYARNYLLPQGKAVLANEDSLKQIEHRKKLLAVKIEKAKSKAQKTKEFIEAKPIKIYKKVGENNKLFGSVTSIDLQKCIEKNGHVVSRKGIAMENPIKELGEFEVTIVLDGDVETKANVHVLAEQDEA